MRSIAAAQWQFATTCGNMKYAATLPSLGKPVPSTGEPFLSPDLTAADSFEKSGYVLAMAAKPLGQAQSKRRLAARGRSGNQDDAFGVPSSAHDPGAAFMAAY